MNKNETAIVIASVFTAGIVASAIKSSLKLHKEERLKREEIRRNRDLDLQAIKNASRKMSEKVATGQYDFDLVKLMDDLDTEFAFEKIAIRSK